MNYCLGFVFSPARDEVLLLEKKRPAFQAGLLNGIGGKLAPGEDPLDGMVRECAEESGLVIAPQDWVPLGRMEGDDFCVHLFQAHALLEKAVTTTDEPVRVVSLADIDTGRLAPWVHDILVSLTGDPRLTEAQAAVASG